MVRRVPSVRVLAALLASIAACGPLLSTEHLATVRHVTCEHGESVELVAPGGGEHQRHAGDCIREVSAASDHGHEHCLIAACRHAGTAPALDACPAVGVETLALAALPAATASPQIALLLQAPKNSPPV